MEEDFLTFSQVVMTKKNVWQHSVMAGTSIQSWNILENKLKKIKNTN